jgi:hypothetical protein
MLVLQAEGLYPDAFGLSKQHVRLKRNAEEKCAL